VRLRLAILLNLIISYAAAGASGECPPLHEPAIGHLERHGGTFVDDYYGYSVQIPRGREALSQPPPDPRHGFDVWLSHDPPRSMYVLAYYKPLAWPLRRVEDDVVGVVREGETHIEIRSHGEKNVGAWRKARRLVITYQCGGKDPWVEIMFLALHSGGRVYYSAGVITRASRQKEDERALRNMLNTWRELPLQK